MHVDPEILKSPYVGLVEGEQVVRVHIAHRQCTSKQITFRSTHRDIAMHLNPEIPQSPYIVLVEGEQVVRVNIDHRQCNSKQITVDSTHCDITMHVDPAIPQSPYVGLVEDNLSGTPTTAVVALLSDNFMERSYIQLPPLVFTNAVLVLASNQQV